MKGLLFAIRCTNDHELFWSNDFGWVDEGYCIFSEKETKVLNLPLEGEWVDYYDMEPI